MPPAPEKLATARVGGHCGTTVQTPPSPPRDGTPREALAPARRVRPPPLHGRRAVPTTAIPGPVLFVLLGAAGSGKSTLARTWPPGSVLELDTFRELIRNDVQDPDSTEEALYALGTVLEGRLARRLTTVVDADSTDPAMRAKLIEIAERHEVPAAALVLTTPLGVCLERNAVRPPHRRVPEDVVREQYAQAVDATPGLRIEGFDHVEALYGGVSAV
ncbi:AAA family ATPase [Streptomyces lunaelactis]|nr:AAA family ATPase [Streptomyces lunaelactis]